MRFLFPLAVAALLGACAPTMDISARYGRLDAQGEAAIDASGATGAADLEQAGLEEEDVLQGRADLKWGSPHLVALAQAPEFTGQGTLDVSVSDGTNTITAGSDVDSRLELGTYDLALVFDLVPGSTFELGLGFGAAYLDLDMAFEELGTGTTVSTEEALPLPLLAATASVSLGPFDLAAFAGGMAYDYDDDSVSFLDADVFARWRIFRAGFSGALVVGYRLTDVDLDYDDDSSQVDVDVRVSGPFVGLDLGL